jgi:MFS family permease
MLSDRIGRPTTMIVVGCAVGTVLVLWLPAMPSAMIGLLLLGAVAGAVPGPLTSLLPRALAPERLAVGLGLSYTTFYLVMAGGQPAAGLARDLTDDPAAPVLFAAAAMAATVLGLLAFRLVDTRDGTER